MLLSTASAVPGIPGFSLVLAIADLVGGFTVFLAQHHALSLLPELKQLFSQAAI